MPEVGDTASGPSWWVVPVVLLLWLLLLYIGWSFRDSTKESSTFPTYAWPNALMLALFSVLTVSLSNTDIRTHRTLASLRLADEGRWTDILRQARYEEHPPRQLSMLTALALSQTGQLADQLFSYPQPWGTDALLPQEGDTAYFHSLPPLVGRHLHRIKTDRTPLDLFFAVADTDAVSPVRDYHLAALLLQRRLPQFAELLAQDSTLSLPLPRHYAEALVILAQRDSSYFHRLDADSLLVPDTLYLADYQRFDSLRCGTSTLLRFDSARERHFQCRRAYGKSYWYYYFFGTCGKN